MQAERQRGAVGHTVNAPLRTRGLRPPWRPGESGNPKGKNASDSKAAFERCVLQLLAERGPDLASVLLSKAMTNSAFMGLLLVRIWPAGSLPRPAAGAPDQSRRPPA